MDAFKPTKNKAGSLAWFKEIAARFFTELLTTAAGLFKAVRGRK